MRLACNAASRGSVRLTESKLFDDLSVIMTIQERRTQEDRETDKRRGGYWCGWVMKEKRWLDGHLTE